jgi:hypothetical protein
MHHGRFGRTHPGTHGTDVGRRRRGAVLVITAAAMAGLMVITAFAVDLSRLYVLRAELQTAADAAALAGAIRLNGDWAQAEASARGVALANASPTDSFKIDEVRFGIWKPEDRTFHAGAKLDTADAAQVIVSRTTTYLFGRLISDGPIRITARATAWAGAPAARADCVKPWFILHHDFMKAISAPHEDLTNDHMRKLRDTASNKRKLTLRLKHAASNPKPDTTKAYFYGMELPAGQAPKNGPTFRENVTGCNTMEQGWIARTEKGNKAAHDSWEGLQELCRPLALNGDCYNAVTGVIGVPITVSIFCTGPEHTSGTMWFQTEWMTGFMVTRGEKEKVTNDFILTGYLIPTQGTGEIRDDRKATGLMRTILVR